MPEELREMFRQIDAERQLAERKREEAMRREQERLIREGYYDD